MALSVEAAELMEEFQWLTEEQSRDLPPERLARVKDEIGDVLNCTLRISKLENRNVKLESSIDPGSQGEDEEEC